mgnify:CR=1 FL=1
MRCLPYINEGPAVPPHESVNAFSRDAILMAKEVAEDHGFHLLHAIIDCVWLKKEGATESEYENIAHAISRRVGIDISLEGMYNWIRLQLLRSFFFTFCNGFLC